MPKSQTSMKMSMRAISSVTTGFTMKKKQIRVAAPICARINTAANK